MCRSRMQSFAVEEGKKRVVTVLSAWRVVQGPMGLLNLTVEGHRLSKQMSQAPGRLSYPIPVKVRIVRSKIR